MHCISSTRACCNICTPRTPVWPGIFRRKLLLGQADMPTGPTRMASDNDKGHADMNRLVCVCVCVSLIVLSARDKQSTVRETFTVICDPTPRNYWWHGHGMANCQIRENPTLRTAETNLCVNAHSDVQFDNSLSFTQLRPSVEIEQCRCYYAA